MFQKLNLFLSLGGEEVKKFVLCWRLGVDIYMITLKSPF
jgi:hypothetical protein